MNFANNVYTKYMSRPRISLQLQHSTAELNAYYQQCENPIERKRVYVLMLLAQGQSRDAVIKKTEYSLVSLLKTIHRYHENGLDGLKDHRIYNPGAPTLLCEQEIHQLLDAMYAAFKQGKIWKARDVHVWLRCHLGKELHFQRSYELRAILAEYLYHEEALHNFKISKYLKQVLSRWSGRRQIEVVPYIPTMRS